MTVESMGWRVARATVLVSLISVTQAAAGGKYALVIGNSNYSAKISGVEDAKAIARGLELDGFSVQCLTDATDQKTTDALTRFKAAISDADLALFFFSGHGYQLEDGEDYLLPVNGDHPLKLKVLINELKIAAPHAQIVLILDACRASLLLLVDHERLVDTKGWHPGLAPVQPLRGVAIAYAALPGQTANSGSPEEMSPYSAELAQLISQPGLEFRELLRKVCVATYSRTGTQLPWDEGTGTLPLPFYLRDVATVDIAIEFSDGDLEVLLNNETVLTWQVDREKGRSLPLRSGDNTLVVKMHNDKAKRTQDNWESPLGWRYGLALKHRQSKLEGCCMGAENIVFKDGPHDGKLFTVATAILHVNAKTGEVTIAAVDTDAWKRGLPASERDQDILAEKQLLTYSESVHGLPLRRHRIVLTIGGIGQLASKSKACVERIGPIDARHLIREYFEKRDSIGQAASDIFRSLRACIGSEVWAAVDDRVRTFEVGN